VNVAARFQPTDPPSGFLRFVLLRLHAKWLQFSIVLEGFCLSAKSASSAVLLRFWYWLRQLRTSGFEFLSDLGFRVSDFRLRWLCWLTLILGMQAQLVAGSPEPQTNGPVIRFLAPVYNFGTALAGDPIEHVFEFTNAGNASLELLGVYPSCSCTLPGESTKQVAPGNTGRVTLMLDTTRFDGPIAESTVVASTDRVHFNVALQFKGTVRKPLEMIPRTVILRPAISGTSGNTNTAKIINHLPDPITLEPPVSDNPAFVGELKTIVPGMQYQLAVRTTHAHQSSPTQGTISIKTSSSRVPLFSVPVLIMPQAGPQPGTGAGPEPGNSAAAGPVIVPSAGPSH
jgi:hypothetical protein